MYRIGIIGHTPEHFQDPAAASRVVERTMDLISYQYDNQLIYNIPGNTGVGLWASNKCLEEPYRYHLFLPFPLDITIAHWYDEQKDHLTKAFSYAYALSVMEPEQVSTSVSNMVNEHIVDNSNFIIAFWMGKKQGHTYDAITYALDNNKLVLNAFKDLKLITNDDIRKARHGRKT